MVGDSVVFSDKESNPTNRVEEIYSILKKVKKKEGVREFRSGQVTLKVLVLVLYYVGLLFNG